MTAPVIVRATSFRIWEFTELRRDIGSPRPTKGVPVT